MVSVGVVCFDNFINQLFNKEIIFPKMSEVKVYKVIHFPIDLPIIPTKSFYRIYWCSIL